LTRRTGFDSLDVNGGKYSPLIPPFDPACDNGESSMYVARQRLIFMTGSFLLMSALVLFFGFHMVAGDRGILARPELDRKIVLAEEKLHLLQRHQTFLSQRIGLMQNDFIDADMLAETARAELGLYAPNDVIITIDLSNLKFSEDIFN
jgi:cell division protein FtsB